MRSQETIKSLKRQLIKSRVLTGLTHSDYKWEEWQRDTRIILQRIFGDKSEQVKEFALSMNPPQVYAVGRGFPNPDLYYQGRLKATCAMIRSMIKELKPGSFGNSPANLESDLPTELKESLKRFREDHSDPSKCVFVIMRFGSTNAHKSILESLRSTVAAQSFKALRADDKEYHGDLFWNILTYIYGCSAGIAVFERIEREEFNPNIALEVGYMMALQKPVLLLKDTTLKYLNTDLIGKLYKTFDPQNIPETIPPQLLSWMRDKKLTL